MFRKTALVLLALGLWIRQLLNFSMKACLAYCSITIAYTRFSGGQYTHICKLSSLPGHQKKQKGYHVSISFI